MSEKAYPIRKCISCGEHKPKQELIRIVKSSESAFFDPTGKKDGRGCYICQNEKCVQNAKKTRRIERALSVKDAQEVYDSIITCFSEEE